MRAAGKQHRRAFTLAEVMVALALVALIMTAAALGLQAAQTSHAYNAEKTELVARVRGVLDRAARDLRRSASFLVVDEHTLAVTLPDGTIHTYAWNGVAGGNLTYTETDSGGIVSNPAVLTGYVQTFTVTNTTPSCTIQIAQAGTRAATSITISATPAKTLY